MDKPIFEKEKKYISASSAGKIFGYTTDYIGQLCRSKKVDGIMIGHFWFVSESDLINHKKSAKTRLARRKYKSLRSVKKIDTTKKIVSQENQDHNKKYFQTEDVEGATPEATSINQTVLDSSTEDLSFIRKTLYEKNTYLPSLKIVKSNNTFITYELEDEYFLFPKITKANADKFLHSKTSPTVIQKNKNSEIFNLRMFRNTVGVSLMAVLLLIFVWSKNEESLIDAQFATRASLIKESFDLREISKKLDMFGDRVSNKASVVAGVFLSTDYGSDKYDLKSTDNFISKAKKKISFWNYKIRMAVIKVMFGSNVAVNTPANSGDKFFYDGDTAVTNISAERDSQNYPNGLVVLPYAEDERVRQTLTNNIQSSFSDEVEIKVDEDGVSGTITPVFREKRGEDYMYVLVPMKEKE